MHAIPEKTGAALLARLLAAAERAGIPIVAGARATRLFVSGDKVEAQRPLHHATRGPPPPLRRGGSGVVAGPDLDPPPFTGEGDRRRRWRGRSIAGQLPRIDAVGIARPGGASEIVGCKALVLACNGYGGNAGLVARHIPEMAGGLYYGHAGNTGDALIWGEALGAKLEHLSAYQGHGSLAHPHGILISWALMTKGAIQVNAAGERFSDESGGYSEQAVAVLVQPGGIAWNVFDRRIHDFALSFPDYREAVAAGAVRKAGNVSELAAAIGAPREVLQNTLDEVETSRRGQGADPFGRDFQNLPPLEPPYCAVRVTGALFHTQGGLMIDGAARVLDAHGRAFPNLFAGGGAACGVSGPEVSGYLSGNGLLTAIAFGFVAGTEAAQASR